MKNLKESTLNTKLYNEPSFNFVENDESHPWNALEAVHHSLDIIVENTIEGV